jgi:hypothetical protein
MDWFRILTGSLSNSAAGEVAPDMLGAARCAVCGAERDPRGGICPNCATDPTTVAICPTCNNETAVASIEDGRCPHCPTPRIDWHQWRDAVVLLLTLTFAVWYIFVRPKPHIDPRTRVPGTCVVTATDADEVYEYRYPNWTEARCERHCDPTSRNNRLNPLNPRFTYACTWTPQ